MKGYLFFLAVILIGLVIWSIGPVQVEGFQAAEAPDQQEASPGPVIPLISPRAQTLLKGEVAPLTPATTDLLGAPPGQIASVGSRPAEDPALEKAVPGRIQSAFESLSGFFLTEAPGLSKIGDPSVQLPMSTAKSDKARLEDELAVLSRNPGLKSSLTMEDMQGIEANLAYLQRKWRQSVAALSGSPMPPGPEGFESGAGPGPNGDNWMRIFYGVEPFAVTGATGGTGSTGGTGGTGGTGSTGSTGTTSGKKSDMSLKDLEDLSLKLNVEIIRLQSTGTTDLNTNARIDVLSSIKKLVDDIAGEVRRGIRLEQDIPMMKAEVAKFLPSMANLNTGIPQFISDLKANPILANLFPKYAAGDISGSEISKQMFEKYAKDFLHNLSWDVTLNYHYKGAAEQEIASNYRQAFSDAKFVAETNSGIGAAGTVPGAPQAYTSTDNGASKAAYRGFFDSVIQSATGVKPTSVDVAAGATGVGAGTAAAGEGAAGDGSPTKFDWKTRSKQICDQVTARGYAAKDFGCLENPDAMRKDGFSWRGYTRMICNRLQTIYEPSVPEMCGCPPPTWPGWKP